MVLAMMLRHASFVLYSWLWRVELVSAVFEEIADAADDARLSRRGERRHFARFDQNDHE